MCRDERNHLRDLVYQGHFSEQTKHDLLRIADADDWVERLFELIKKLDTHSDFEPGGCFGCQYRDNCSTKEDADAFNEIEHTFADMVVELSETMDDPDARITMQKCSSFDSGELYQQILEKVGRLQAAYQELLTKDTP